MKSYIDLINHYWEIFKRYKLTPMEGYFYFYILNILNRARWQEVAIPNVQIMEDLGLTKKSILRIRDKLTTLNLIRIRVGRNQYDFPIYHIPDNIEGTANGTAELQSQGDSREREKMPYLKEVQSVVYGDKGTAEPPPKGNGRGNSIPIIDKDNKTIKKENIKRKKAENSGLALKFESPKKEPKRQDEFQPPSLEDVIMLCVGKGISEDEAKKFFFYYDAQGWVTSSGQKIKRIDSMVNRWMSNKKDKDDGKFKDEHTKARERNDEIARDILSRYT